MFFNKLVLRMSYYESMEQVDNSLTQRIVTQADNHRVPVSSDVISSNIIQDPMDDYDDRAGDDTILMLSQDQAKAGLSINPLISKLEKEC